MHRLSVFKAWFAASLVVGLASCADKGATSVAPTAPTQPATTRTDTLHSGGTTFGGKADFEAALRPRAWLSPGAKSGKGLLYVSAYHQNYVDIYKQKGNDQAPIGTITTGLSGPEGMAVDRNLNLYVTNTSNNTVTVYPPGQLSPSVTYSQGLNAPAGVTVGRDGTVYVSNLFGGSGNNGSIVEYPTGQTTPSVTISITFPIDVTLDRQNNLYASYGISSGGIEEFAPGSSQGTDLGIVETEIGSLAIDANHNIVVANQGYPAEIDVFAQGQTSPKLIFGQQGHPNPIAFNKRARKLYVGNTGGNQVLVYAYPSGTLINTISNGVDFDAGVALSPESRY